MCFKEVEITTQSLRVKLNTINHRNLLIEGSDDTKKIAYVGNKTGIIHLDCKHLLPEGDFEHDVKVGIDVNGTSIYETLTFPCSELISDKLYDAGVGALMLPLIEDHSVYGFGMQDTGETIRLDPSFLTAGGASLRTNRIGKVKGKRKPLFKTEVNLPTRRKFPFDPSPILVKYE